MSNILDFEYVVQRPGKPRLCFGSTLERSELRPISRFEIQFTSKYSNVLAPGSNYKFNRPISKLGTVLGGRTAPREPPPRLYETPPPGAYSPKYFESKLPITMRKPSILKRGSKQATVGPGYYNLSGGHRTMEFANTFGGKKFLKSAVELKCIPINHDTCEKCRKPPVGDYWQLTDPYGVIRKTSGNGEQDTWHLCRVCYRKEKRQPTLFTRQQIQHFKKVRDCSKIHFHDGCEARLLLLPPRDIDKIREKEAYLALYFS